MYDKVCPDCETKNMIPVHYGFVDFATIDRVIQGFVYLGGMYKLENWYCKDCKNLFQL